MEACKKQSREEIIHEIEQMAKRMRKHTLDMAMAAGGKSSHFGAGLSIIEIAATLYGQVMRHECDNPQWSDRDRFILSKGHGVLGYYAALADAGFIPVEDLQTFEKTGSYLFGHPVIDRRRGIEFTNGSLGMGLSLGIGVAIAGKKRNRDFKVYVLMGDGECNEGSIWEAVMAAAHYKLDNLVAIIDRNQLQLGGCNSDIMCIGDMAAKLNCFGWDTIEVDGHDAGQLYDAFNRVTAPGKPIAIVANTVKGKGFSFSENNNAWHHAPLSKSNYEAAIDELVNGGTQDEN